MMIRNTLRLYLVAVFVVMAASAANAQGTTATTISNRVLTALAAQENRWQLSKTILLTDTQFSQLWADRQLRMSIDLDLQESQEAAAAWLNGMMVSGPGGAHVPDIGDDARLWGGNTASGAATIYFRKGNAAAMVSAPSVAMATRIAQLVATQIY
jgi:hypothetical protein